jgi:hypothetical protein
LSNRPSRLESNRAKIKNPYEHEPNNDSCIHRISKYKDWIVNILPLGNIIGISNKNELKFIHAYGYHMNKYKSFLTVLFPFSSPSLAYVDIVFINLVLLLLCLSYHSVFVFCVYTGQSTDDNKTTRRHQQQHNGIESEDENATAGMFQANYQYTPLKEYAAMRSGRTTNDNTTNGYRSK